MRCFRISTSHNGGKQTQALGPAEYRSRIALGQRNRRETKVPHDAMIATMRLATPHHNDSSDPGDRGSRRSRIQTQRRQPRTGSLRTSVDSTHGHHARQIGGEAIHLGAQNAGVTAAIRGKVCLIPSMLPIESESPDRPPDAVRFPATQSRTTERHPDRSRGDYRFSRRPVPTEPQPAIDPRPSFAAACPSNPE